MATASTAALLAGCGGGGDSDALSDDEQHRIDEALTKLYCEEYGAVISASERERAAEDLAAIYRDKPDASYKPPALKDEQPLEEVVEERQAELEGCDPATDLEAIAAAADLGRARLEVAHGEDGE